MSDGLGKIGRMPRLQDREADSSATGNANSPISGKGLSNSCSGNPWIEGGRQGLAASDSQKRRSGPPGFEGGRQVADRRGGQGSSSGNSGFEVGRQVDRSRARHPRCSGNPGFEGERQVENPWDQRQADQQVRRYTFKLYPNKAQEAALVRQAALLAQLWNAALEQRETQWAHECQRKAKGERKGLSRFDQQKELKVIRASDPEYAAMGADTMALCLAALDDAFKAFFRRARSGAGKSSGYPRYKSTFAIENKGADCTIWHRDHRKGWRLDKAGKHFKVYAKGIPGTIRARGRFPVAVDDLELRDMRLIRVSGEWFCSIVVKMDARRSAGAHKVLVEFDLIDEFATVKGANGECLPGWEADFSSADEQISPLVQGVGEGQVRPSPECGDSAGAIRGRSPKPRVRPSPECGDSAGELGLSIRDPDVRPSPEQGESAGPAAWSGRRTWVRPSPDVSETDAIQSERDRRFKKFSCRWRAEKRRIAKRKAKEARQRKEALHRWTTKLVSQSAELAVVCPPIKDSTQTARGNEKAHGAAVKPVAILNRHVLAQAPAMAIQMIEYKAAEAGIPFARVTPDEHALEIGRDLPTATKAVRRLRRELRKAETV